jgi:predicted AlkP superfamily phosphohydrolase/phosphomutase
VALNSIVVVGHMDGIILTKFGNHHTLQLDSYYYSQRTLRPDLVVPARDPTFTISNNIGGPNYVDCTQTRSNVGTSAQWVYSNIFKTCVHTQLRESELL